MIKLNRKIQKLFNFFHNSLAKSSSQTKENSYNQVQTKNHFKFKIKAFSLIELSIVILIIGILVAGVTQSSRLVKRMRLATAVQITSSSDVNTINDLEMWLETTQDFAFATGTNASFDFVNNIYTDVDRPSDQDKIGRWNDESIRNATAKKSAIQNALVRQPIYVENGINGLPSVHFNATASQAVCMHAPINIDRGLMPNLSIFVVYRWLNTFAAYDQKLWSADNMNWDRQAIMRCCGGGTSGMISTGSTAVTIPNFNNSNVNQIFSYISRTNISNGSMSYINGASPVYFTETHPSQSYPALTFPGENNQSFGMSLDGNCVNNTNVMIGEFLVFNRALNAEERSSIERYLARKWGIKLS
jgi:prepilin-type N-terminal cleavage/methylation domain-containing protein